MVHVSQFVALMIFPRSSSGLKTEPFPFLYELYLLCWCCKLIHSDTIHWNISAVFHLWTYFAFLIVNCSTCIYAPGTHPCSVSYIFHIFHQLQHVKTFTRSWASEEIFLDWKKLLCQWWVLIFLECFVLDALMI